MTGCYSPSKLQESTRIVEMGCQIIVQHVEKEGLLESYEGPMAHLGHEES